MKNITPDPWIEEKKAIERFYKTCFDIVIDWQSIVLPKYDKMYPRLEYVPIGLTCLDYRNRFEKDFANNPHSQNLDTIISWQQNGRPNNDYAFAWKGIHAASTSYGKGYYGFCNDGNDYMIPKEAIVAVLRKRFEGEIFHTMIALHALDYSEDILYLGNDEKALTIYFGAPNCARNPCRIKL
jgi:hypothetical protein